MRPTLSLAPRIFYPTCEWKRLFASGPLILSIWPIIIICMVELGLWTAGPFSNIVALLFGIGVYIAYLFMGFFIIYLLTKPIRHIVTSEGITFCSSTYHIYTPWNNIRGIGKGRFGIYHPQTLLLLEPAVKGSIRDGDLLERATIEYRWPIIKKDAPDDAIPLLFTVPANWQESELGIVIKQYAPQAFSNQKNVNSLYFS